MASWYCLIDDQEYGPYSSEQVQSLIQEGRLTREHFVRPSTDNEWTAAVELPGLFPSEPPKATPVEVAPPKATPLRPAPPKATPVEPAAPEATPVKAPAPKAIPVEATPPKATPVEAAPPKATPVTPAAPKASPVKAAAPKATPVKPATPKRRASEAATPKAGPAQTPPPAAAKPAAATATAKPATAKPATAASEEPPVPKAMPVAAKVVTPVATPVAPAAGTASAPPPAPPTAPPLAPPPVPAVPAGEPSRAAARVGRKSKNQQYVVVGGLAVAFIALAGIVVGVLGRSPGTQSDKHDVAPSTADSSTTDAAAIGDAEADPNAEADPIVVEPVAKQAAADRKPVLPRIDRWLDASRKKGILRAATTMVRFQVVSAWLDPSDTAPENLTVEVNVTNASSSGSLDFRGWTAARDKISKDTVVLVDDKGDPLTLASVASRAGGPRRSSRRLGPGESVTELLVFDKPSSDYQHLRLALPYAAIGRTGYIGFEIPRVMVMDRPPEAEKPQPVARQPAIAEPIPVAGDQEFDMTGAPSQSGQSETIDALREAIRGDMTEDGQSAPDAMSGSPPSSTPGKPDGPIDGLRRAVDGADTMGEDLQNE